MKLNHINLTVTDVLETHAFLIKYFGLANEWPEANNKGMAFLTDDDGMVISMFKANSSTPPKYPGNFHIGFIQENADKVNEINKRLRDDGYNVPPPSEQHGSWTFYFQSPGGFTIEVLS